MSNARPIVILTQAQDEHALLVVEALRLLKAPVSLISHSSLPGRGDIAIGGDWNDPSISIGDVRSKVSDIRSFWNRRPPVGLNFPDRTHPADFTHISDAFRHTISGLASLLDDQFAVNKQASARITSNKLNQIRMAARCNLKIPKTLVSNDKEEILAFGSTVDVLCMKPLAVYAWKAGQALTVTLTTLVEDATALDPESTALMPQIFQEFVPKAYEVRLTMFGRVAVATRLSTATVGEGAIDWRADGSYRNGMRRIEPPAEVIAQCRALMTALDLRFGSFDFVVTPQDEWVFMEVNQAGQFAWQERHDPKSCLVEPFARYLMAASDDFSWDPAQASAELSYASLATEVFEGERYKAHWQETAPDTDQAFADEDAALAAFNNGETKSTRTATELEAPSVGTE